MDGRGSAAAPGAVINLPAMVIVLLIMVLLIVGIRESARFNAAMVTIKIVAVLFFLAAGTGASSRQLDAVHALWMGGRHDGRGGVFCLHRIRRGLDNG